MLKAACCEILAIECRSFDPKQDLSVSDEYERSDPDLLRTCGLTLSDERSFRRTGKPTMTVECQKYQCIICACSGKQQRKLEEAKIGRMWQGAKEEKTGDGRSNPLMRFSREGEEEVPSRVLHRRFRRHATHLSAQYRSHLPLSYTLKLLSMTFQVFFPSFRSFHSSHISDCESTYVF